MSGLKMVRPGRSDVFEVFKRLGFGFHDAKELNEQKSREKVRQWLLNRGASAARIAEVFAACDEYAAQKPDGGDNEA